MDIYARTPVNKLARIITNQSNVSDSFVNNASQISGHLEELQKETKLICERLNIPFIGRGIIFEMCRKGEINPKTPIVRRLFQLIKRERQIIQSLKEEIKPHIMLFKTLAVGDKFEVWRDGKFKRICTVQRISCSHFHGDDNKVYSRKTGRSTIKGLNAHLLR